MRLLNFVSLIAVIIVNVLANALPINNLNTGQISDFYPVLFTPAGYVFSIWGLIYLLLLAFSIYQLLPSQQNNPNLSRIGGWFIAANVFNAAWIFTWHYLNVPLSMVFMLGLLGSLLAVYLRLNIGKEHTTQIDQTFYHFPFSVYLGWISVATIANFSILFYTLGWNGWGLSPDLWTLIVIVVGAILSMAMIRLRNEIAYPLVIVWAFAGILFKSESPQLVGTAAGLAATAILLYLAITLLKSRQLALVEARKNRENLIR